MSQSYQSASFDQWQSGVAFNDALVEFGDDRLVQLYRDADTEGGIEANRAMLVIDLWERLRDGKLTAIGRCVTPTVSDGPIPIPLHFFHDRPSLSAGKHDDLEMAGWRYESVRISPPERLSPSSTAIEAPSLVPKKRGPKPFTPLIEAAIERLRITDPQFEERSQEKRIVAIQAEVAAQNPAKFPKRSRPSHTVIWNHLKRLSN
ncbi:hypothetical protein EQZ23_15720 [Sphingomonas sp. UV9]|uniref:hypothetical protein n=1 Tax=Sphingomonas sp. UV9 TaxID=1851410 RepID=UPI000FFC58C7|nr:hypothetical protein [Sphingomonas sp. UV9]RXD03757.1 hypothetical protein EQZ23_15720 [Sphingomonas sp. UV9]